MQPKSSCGVKYSHMDSGVLQKTAVNYHSLLLHQEMQLNICYSRRRLYINSMQQCRRILWAGAHLRCSKRQGWQMSPHFNLFPGKMDFEFSVPKTKGTFQTFISDRSKSKRLSWYGSAADQTALVACVRRYHWHGGIHWDCTETYSAIKMTSFMGSPWKWYQDNARSHSECATTAWFRRQSECARLASRSVSYWKCMAHHEKENQTTFSIFYDRKKTCYFHCDGKHYYAVQYSDDRRVQILNSLMYHI